MSEAAHGDDSAARRAAIDPSLSVLLEAPAGSGKTTVLAQRFLRLLCTVEDPAEILAITFTRRAAAEMRARITRALRGEVSADSGAAQELRAPAARALAHGAARGWNLEASVQGLRIQTIDAFNYRLATELPLASGIGGRLQVSDTPEELYARAARRTLLAAEADPELAPDAQLLFERLDNHWLNFERLLAQMLAQRGHWLRFVLAEPPQRLCARVNESLAALARAQLRALRALLPEALRQQAERLPGVPHLGFEPADLSAWQRLTQLTFTHQDWRRQVNAHRLGAAFADPALCRELKQLIDALGRLPGMREALLELRSAPDAQLSAGDAAAISALSRLLARAAAELHAEFALAQRVDHTYATGAARAALTEQGEPTDLALRTGWALKHILVDEFQDTSLAQFQLLEALTITWEPGDGRTLFVVGDPMQSIYGFRDAEVGLFARARERGIGRVRLRPLRLTRNFRTLPELLAFTNEAFAAIFPPSPDLRAGAVCYTPGSATRPAGIAPEQAVCLELFPDQRQAEVRAIVARIGALRRADREASVAVLVLAHAHAQPIVAALAAAGLEALGVDLVPLRERAVVRDLIQLTRALYDLADRSAWLAVLRAPWCGARLASLAALSRASDRQLIIEALADPERLGGCLEEDRPRLLRVRALLGEALEARAGAPVADWLEAVWLRLGAPDAYPEAELEDARAFFGALAARAAAGEWRGPQDFAALLAGLSSAPRAVSPNPVQVMTIHRAKGLEFDHVFMPALDRPIRFGARRLLHWIDLPGESAAGELLIAPDPPVGVEEGALHAWIKALRRRRELNERKRLVYVAATRARASLWLSGAPRSESRGGVRVAPHSLLAALWPVLGERFGHRTGGAVEAVPGAAGVPLRRLVAAWEPAPLAPAVTVTRLPAAPLEPEPPEFSWVGETQRHIGTLVHEWLARLAAERVVPTPGQIEAQRGAVEAQLERRGVATQDVPRAAARVLEAVRRTLADERGRWLLAGQHREAHSELALTGVSDGRLRSIVIDRSFIAADGTRWVIDYKTSAHAGGGLEEFLEAELERYRPQLETYRALTRLLGPQPVRVALYFPLLGAFCELSERP